MELSTVVPIVMSLVIPPRIYLQVWGGCRLSKISRLKPPVSCVLCEERARWSPLPSLPRATCRRHASLGRLLYILCSLRLLRGIPCLPCCNEEHCTQMQHKQNATSPSPSPLVSPYALFRRIVILFFRVALVENAAGRGPRITRNTSLTGLDGTSQFQEATLR